MNVVLRERRRVEIDNMRNSLNINPTSCDVRCDENIVLTLFESCERTLSLRLCAVGVDRNRFHTALLEAARDLVRSMLGTGEDEHTVKSLRLQNVEQQTQLCVLLNRIEILADRFHRTLLLSDLDELGIVLNGSNKGFDLFGHRR